MQRAEGRSERLMSQLADEQVVRRRDADQTEAQRQSMVREMQQVGLVMLECS